MCGQTTLDQIRGLPQVVELDLWQSDVTDMVTQVLSEYSWVDRQVRDPDRAQTPPQ